MTLGYTLWLLSPTKDYSKSCTTDDKGGGGFLLHPLRKVDNIKLTF
jgi:hypothetical protein